MKDVYKIAQLTASNVVSIGSSLAHVHVPGRSVTEPSEDELTFNETEIGMGTLAPIAGEANTKLTTAIRHPQ